MSRTQRFVIPTMVGEHIVHIDGVVGSSPTVTTEKYPPLAGGCFFVITAWLRIISHARCERVHIMGRGAERRQWRMKRGGSVVSNKSCERHRSRTPIANLTERAKRSETVGSSQTVTTTNPVGVQVQRLPDFFCVPLRVRTFRSQEYALFCQRGTQKGCADHLKTAYPCKRLVHINQCPLVRITSDISYQQVSRQIGIHRTLYVGSQILRHVCSAFFTVIRFIPAFFIQTHPSRIVIPHEEHA